MKKNNGFKIKKVYPIRDQKYFMVHLDESDCEFLGKFGSVEMIIGESAFAMNYVGISNINGVVVLKVTALDYEDTTFETISQKLLDNTNDDSTYIEFKCP